MVTLSDIKLNINQSANFFSFFTFRVFNGTYMLADLRFRIFGKPFNKAEFKGLQTTCNHANETSVLSTLFHIDMY